eukprot:GHVP01036387.1.p1 GENE.GHVP01036387.1~~GHVP01036387.1.p1  ORF type:complete len:110 (+),score=3.60 GHVP01036387.1:1505-1834(+)
MIQVPSTPTPKLQWFTKFQTWLFFWRKPGIMVHLYLNHHKKNREGGRLCVFLFVSTLQFHYINQTNNLVHRNEIISALVQQWLSKLKMWRSQKEFIKSKIFNLIPARVP